MSVTKYQRHLLIIEDDNGRQEITLESNLYSIGRDAKCDIRLFSQFVSRTHATLVRRSREDGSHYYRIIDGDLKGKTSANGILINGRKFKAYDLKHKDEIVFAPQVLAIYYLQIQDPQPQQPTNEFDISLTNGNIIEEPEKLDPHP
ncbi:MAG TPA: FHA domain-containing protein [Candidatus Obscuribacterales bacterium]